MNPKTRQRVMRSFLASLLQSDLASFEIDELADELNYGSFGKQLGKFIRDAMDGVNDAGKHNPEFTKELSSAKSMYETIIQRRIPKKSLIQLMTIASPRLKPKQFSANASIPELLEKYLALADPNEVEALSSIVEGEPADAYLKGISRRSREK